jgi:uncharacterized protein YjeT (DUF2065 family)
MIWSDPLGAFARYLVLEGILPFASPPAMKRVMLAFSQLADKYLRCGLRLWGFLSMLAGLILLYAVRG